MFFSDYIPYQYLLYFTLCFKPSCPHNFKYLSCLHTPTIFTINMFPQGVFLIEKWLLRFLLKILKAIDFNSLITSYLIFLTSILHSQLMSSLYNLFKYSKKNKGSPKTADIYLSTPLLWSFLLDLVLSSVLKLFICPNMDFLFLS